MGEFFAKIYDWFTGLYGVDLAEHLRGWDMESGDYTQANQFISLGWGVIIISLFFAFLFYFVINHPRFNKWWSWLIILLINGVVNFIYGWRLTSGDLSGNAISEDLLCVKNPETGIVEYYKILESNCVYFGLANAIIAILFFILFSFCMRRWSRNCSTCPFPN